MGCARSAPVAAPRCRRGTGRRPARHPGIELNGENLAYVIYTSGSTGKPKGAGNRHSALSNRLCWMQ
ncbi:AMP-binding protein, partial [Pseudomonas aeruginosa]|nr:AMP-binding protein [Pseudomonas aeruginosa]